MHFDTVEIEFPLDSVYIGHGEHQNIGDIIKILNTCCSAFSTVIFEKKWQNFIKVTLKKFNFQFVNAAVFHLWIIIFQSREFMILIFIDLCVFLLVKYDNVFK